MYAFVNFFSLFLLLKEIKLLYTCVNLNFLQYLFLNIKRLGLFKKMPIKKIQIILIILVISILALFIINGSNFKAAFTFYDIDIVSYLKDNSSTKISKILLGVAVAKS
jgi:hypothetical protein